MKTIASIFTDNYWSPYADGIGIGILSWLSLLISGKPLATSGSFALMVLLLLWIEKAVV
ncbi:MAG TPA: hypothetical protein VK861_05385 [Bacteroidales bacterium]|nr:hypothetical protein [Bacteroidales bacterium]